MHLCMEGHMKLRWHVPLSLFILDSSDDEDEVLELNVNHVQDTPRPGKSFFKVYFKYSGRLIYQYNEQNLARN